MSARAQDFDPVGILQVKRSNVTNEKFPLHAAPGAPALDLESDPVPTEIQIVGNAGGDPELHLIVWDTKKQDKITWYQLKDALAGNVWARAAAGLKYIPMEKYFVNGQRQTLDMNWDKKIYNNAESDKFEMFDNRPDDLKLAGYVIMANAAFKFPTYDAPNGKRLTMSTGRQFDVSTNEVQVTFLHRFQFGNIGEEDSIQTFVFEKRGDWVRFRMQKPPPYSSRPAWVKLEPRIGTFHEFKSDNERDRAIKESAELSDVLKKYKDSGNIHARVQGVKNAGGKFWIKLGFAGYTGWVPLTRNGQVQFIRDNRE